MKLTKIYDIWLVVLSYVRSAGLLAIRLCWGYQFFMTGKGKLLHLDQIANYFETLHIPLPKLNAIIAGSTECFGGLLLLLGLGSRIVTVPLIFTMCVAYTTAERESLSDPKKFVDADPFFFLLCCVIVLLVGPGLISLDALIAKLRGRTPKPTLA